MAEEIHLEKETDRWRYTCPAGHRDWEPTNYHFWCAACARSHDPRVDPSFHYLVDARTGAELAREDVDLIEPDGTFEERARKAACG